MDHAVTLVAFCIILHVLVPHVVGTCSEPSLPANGYPMTVSAQTYAINATYEIFCKPGYAVSGETKLSCLASGSWTNQGPTCTPSEGDIPWWVAFVAMVGVILLVPCIVPRIIFCICGPKGKNSKKSGPSKKSLKDQESGGQMWNEKPPLR